MPQSVAVYVDQQSVTGLRKYIPLSVWKQIHFIDQFYECVKLLSNIYTALCVTMYLRIFIIYYD